MADSIAVPFPSFPVADAAVSPPQSGQENTVAASHASSDSPAGGSSAPDAGASSAGASSAGASAASPSADASEKTVRAQHAAESEALTEQGIQLCRTARWRAAIEPLRRATELDAANAMAFYYLGDAHNHTDSLSAALEAFESASRLQPDHWRALKGVGIVLDRMRRPQEAAAAYQRAREAQSKSPTH
jgi:Flp pilus assembly protein TadD